MEPLTLLWAFLILFGIAAILGIGLALAAKFFYVKEDERIGAVEGMLPNYNCGSCGYAGCHEMAEHIVKGDEKKLSKCKPGKKDKNFDPIIAYMTAHPDEDGTPHIPTI